MLDTSQQTWNAEQYRREMLHCDDGLLTTWCSRLEGAIAASSYIYRYHPRHRLTSYVHNRTQLENVRLTVLTGTHAYAGSRYLQAQGRETHGNLDPGTLIGAKEPGAPVRYVLINVDTDNDHYRVVYSQGEAPQPGLAGAVRPYRLRRTD